MQALVLEAKQLAQVFDVLDIQHQVFDMFAEVF